MRLLALLLVLAGRQDPVTGPVKAKQALAAARVAASERDPSFVFVGFGFKPSSDKVLASGRRDDWTFQFATRAKCAPGKMRILEVKVVPDTDSQGPEKKINGLRIGGVQETEIEPPFPAKVEDDWLDSDRACAAFRKEELAEAAGVKLLEVRWFQSQTLWRAVDAKDGSLYLDGAGKTFPQNEYLERNLLVLYSKPASLEEIEAILRRDVAEWKDAGEVKIYSLEARAYDPAAFLKDFKVLGATLEIYVEKPEGRIYTVRVAHGRVEWFKKKGDEALQKDQFAALKSWSFKKLNPAILRQRITKDAQVKAYLKKFPDAPVLLKTKDFGSFMVVFEGTEPLTVEILAN